MEGSLLEQTSRAEEFTTEMTVLKFSKLLLVASAAIATGPLLSFFHLICVDLLCPSEHPVVNMKDYVDFFVYFDLFCLLG